MIVSNNWNQNFSHSLNYKINDHKAIRIIIVYDYMYYDDYDIEKSLTRF
jgi:hypothetical protein